MFPSFVVASIVIVHAYLEHDAVVLYRRHLMCPSHTYATPPFTEISNCAGSTPPVSKPVRLWFQFALCMQPIDVHVFSKLTFGRIDSSPIMIPHPTVVYEHVCTGRTHRQPSKGPEERCVR